MDNTDEISSLRRQETQDIDPDIEHDSYLEATPPKRKSGFPKGTPRPARKSDRWQDNTEESFYAWLEDIKPRILTRAGKWEVWNPTPEQKHVIAAVFTQDHGKLKHSMILDEQPRRHGKSTTLAMICLFFFTARRNYCIGLLGNNDAHSRRVQFKRIADIIKNTSSLRLRIDPDKDIQHDRIKQDTWQNVIFLCGVSTSGAFGDKINLLWVSDMHASPDLAPFNALQASLLDSEDSIILIDSNVDALDGPVSAIEKEAETDSSIWASHVEYRDFEDFCNRAPEWIDRKKAKRIQRTALEVDFNRDILGKRSSAVNSLFPEILIQGAMDSYRMPVESIRDLTHGRPYKIGLGLDRAKLLSPLMGGDHSILTTIMKVAQVSGEPEYYVLDLTDFLMNTSKAIKSKIVADHKKYGITNCVLENFEVMDLVPFIAEQQISHEVIHATDVAQNAIFPEFHRIVKDGRLHIPANCTQLADEMRTFIYTQKKYGSYSFGHSSQQFKDDCVYATAWAIFSLRNEILTVYKLDHIDCQQHSAIKRNLCFMMGGTLQLGCSQQCRAFHEVREMFKDFKAFNQLDSELSIPDFYRAYVKASDAVIQFQAM